MAANSRNRRSGLKKSGSIRKRALWIGVVFILCAALIASLKCLGDSLYDFPENITSFPPDAVIVCLTGGKGRIEAAINLYAQGVGSGLHVIGAGKKTSVGMLLKMHVSDEIANSISAQRVAQILVETESRNTIENAFAVNRLLLNSPAVKTIVLVTSGYHMRRAQFMIENQMHGQLRIVPYTPPKEAIERHNWWKSAIGIEVTLTEYFKLLTSTIIIPKLEYI